ncbi:hypothetical protein CRE_29139 [Caenorhabditis remanei]|uniref:Uncharacterized protein n=1 Tax=Caenorhabditis remanei TaxID=31234 RepID=E3N4K5_CAERE|nr:hypothetical protein CRE_29139 [Caenorhabditis remanei]
MTNYEPVLKIGHNCSVENSKMTTKIYLSQIKIKTELPLKVFGNFPAKSKTNSRNDGLYQSQRILMFPENSNMAVLLMTELQNHQDCKRTQEIRKHQEQMAFQKGQDTQDFKGDAGIPGLLGLNGPKGEPGVPLIENHLNTQDNQDKKIFENFLERKENLDSQDFQDNEDNKFQKQPDGQDHHVFKKRTDSQNFQDKRDNLDLTDFQEQQDLRGELERPRQPGKKFFQDFAERGESGALVLREMDSKLLQYEQRLFQDLMSQDSQQRDPRSNEIPEKNVEWTIFQAYQDSRENWEKPDLWDKRVTFRNQERKWFSTNKMRTRDCEVARSSTIRWKERRLRFSRSSRKRHAPKRRLRKERTTRNSRTRTTVMRFATTARIFRIFRNHDRKRPFRPEAKGESEVPGYTREKRGGGLPGKDVLRLQPPRPPGLQNVVKPGEKQTPGLPGASALRGEKECRDSINHYEMTDHQDFHDSGQSGQTEIRRAPDLPKALETDSFLSSSLQPPRCQDVRGGGVTHIPCCKLKETSNPITETSNTMNPASKDIPPCHFCDMTSITSATTPRKITNRTGSQ